MVTYPNQNIIRINKPHYERDFLQIGINEWQEAAKQLSPSTFKIYLYLAGNMNGYNLALSKQDIANKLGISSTRYYEAIKALKRHHYICDDGKNHLQFFVKPNPEYGKNHGINNWGSPEMDNKTPYLEQRMPKTDQNLPKTCIEIDNKYKYIKTDKTNYDLSMFTIAEELEGILFNKDVCTEDWETISEIIDTEAYNRAVRQFLAKCDKDEQKYKEDCINFVFRLLQSKSDEDIKKVYEIVNRHINQEEM